MLNLGRVGGNTVFSALTEVLVRRSVFFCRGHRSVIIVVPLWPLVSLRRQRLPKHVAFTLYNGLANSFAIDDTGNIVCHGVLVRNKRQW
eukprot:TRINITY_DN6571_c0_g1_i1.p1 TRINITY_DN6571_c0_g1~~TRINITY_DN6571_c0_g1_i1.p1  ORF type:complete len:100 (+),score=2.54 TRINITY_DN6571_c0_g1_i1:35-301(+)